MHDQSANQVVRPGWRVGPWAAFYATITHGAFFVCKVETGAALCIQFPGFVTVVHHLIAYRNSSARAVFGANLAILAEVD